MRESPPALTACHPLFWRGTSPAFAFDSGFLSSLLSGDFSPLTTMDVGPFVGFVGPVAKLSSLGAAQPLDLI